MSARMSHICTSRTAPRHQIIVAANEMDEWIACDLIPKFSTYAKVIFSDKLEKLKTL